MDVIQEPLFPLPGDDDSGGVTPSRPHPSRSRRRRRDKVADGGGRLARRRAAGGVAAAGDDADESVQEPSGTLDRPSFVIQTHAAHSLHQDFRLEANGVLVSWALPKGVPTGAQNRLAVQTDDHPLSYATFEGDVEASGHLMSHVEIWDQGVYEIHEWQDAKIVVTLHPAEDAGGLHGQPLTLILLHTGRPDLQDWLMRRVVRTRSS